MEQLGERIRALREKNGLTIIELSERVEITSDHLGRIERGEAKNPGIQIISRIAEALGVELKDLLSDAA